VSYLNAAHLRTLAGKADCPACNTQQRHFEMAGTTTLQAFITTLKTDVALCVRGGVPSCTPRAAPSLVARDCGVACVASVRRQLTNPSIGSSAGLLFAPGKSGSMGEGFTANLAKPLRELIASGGQLAIYDPVYPKDHAVLAEITFTDEEDGGAAGGAGAGAGAGAPAS